MRYPCGISKNYKTNIQYDNRGMSLEEDLNQTNEYYRINKKAIIYKKPTPITIVKVDYKSRYEAVIKEAYFRTPSTTDYNGIYCGKYIDFEAKETKLDYFPLSNIHPHQIEHLKNISEMNGIGFLIVRFTKKQITYLLETKKLLEFIDTQKRKSIPIEYFENNGHQIIEKYNPRLDYLKIVDQICFKGEFYEKDV